jgi:hypothetical protein
MTGHGVVMLPNLLFVLGLVLWVVRHLLFELLNLLHLLEYVDEMPHDILAGKTKMNRCDFTLVDLRLFHLSNHLELILQDVLQMSSYHGLE